ncbi:MAG: ribosome silencing factor [candidate division WOR-3 bacterium]|nr:MAG: ribosome silencing factor [candidate division WOR-3 bacterium]
MSSRNYKEESVKDVSTDLAKKLARIIDEKRGEEIIIFDLRGLSPITDHFVIATGLSEVHVKNIADHLMKNESPQYIEGLEASSWVLLDFIDVVVHVFSKDARDFYGLERLWGDAPTIDY